MGSGVLCGMEDGWMHSTLYMSHVSFGVAKIEDGLSIYLC